MKKDNIYQFNHIDKDLSQETINEIKAFYSFYHKKWWCYLKAFKHFKRLNIMANMSSVLLIVIGTIAGGVTLHPIILGSITQGKLRCANLLLHHIKRH